MRQLFIIILVFLIAFSQFMNFRGTKTNQNLISVFWATAAHSTRTKQAELFQAWLVQNHYTNFLLKLDSANIGSQKTIIQGVTGIASDIIDNATGNDVHFYEQIGFIEDITDLWKDFGVSSSNYHTELAEDSFIDGKRYSYLGNADVSMLAVNREAFKRVNLPMPTYRMDIATFEKVGIEYTALANKGLKRQKYFFLGGINFTHLRRSAGVSYFNETLTSAALNRPETIQAMNIHKKWINESHLIPTLAERQSFASEAGVGTAEFQLFYLGNIAMTYTGRWILMQLRVMGHGLDMTTVEPPHISYPTAQLGGRSIFLYKGSQKKDLAKYFFLFLSGETYNKYIIECGDSLPPNPAYLEDETLLRPAKYTNEWEFTQNYVKGFKSVGQGLEYSPFAAPSPYIVKERKIYEAFFSDILTAEEAAKQLDKAVNEEIAKMLFTHPEIKPRYEKALAKQLEIDKYKNEGKKIPAALVDNSFLKRYYKDIGKLAD